jgi:hypothetical protein
LVRGAGEARDPLWLGLGGYRRLLVAGLVPIGANKGSLYLFPGVFAAGYEGAVGIMHGLSIGVHDLAVQKPALLVVYDIELV